MKKITFIVARKSSIGGELTAEREGYLFTHSNHPGREFALMRTITVSGRQTKGWAMVELSTGLRISGVGKCATRHALADAATAYLHSVSAERMESILQAAMVRRTTQILAEGKEAA